MANLDAPKGFIPTRFYNGAGYDGRHILAVLTGATGNTFIGDVVKHSGAGAAANTKIAGLNCEGMPIVARATSGTTGQDVFGVVVGFLPDPTQLGLKYRVDSTDRVAMVVPAHDVVFEVQEDADTTPLAAADVGQNISFTLTAGNTATGVSGMEIDSSAKNTTATLPCKILGLVQRVDNAYNTGGSAVDCAKYEVIFNTYLAAPNVVGV